MTVHQGWINIDASPNAFFCTWPKFAKRRLYRLTGARHNFSCSEYLRLLTDYCYVHFDLKYGIPYKDDTVDYVFSSHFFEHMHKGEAFLLLKEVYRALRKNGLIRLSVPDLEYAIGLYESDKITMLEKYFFIDGRNNDFSTHKYMYDFEMLRDILNGIGFQDIEKSSYRAGRVSDFSELDNRPKDSLFVEAIKK